MSVYKQVALIVLDGWGHNEDPEHNAVFDAHTPNFDELVSKYPHSLLMAGEEHVGLPKGQVGNSEIGHTTIGAGTVIDTDLVRIRKAIDDGSFDSNEEFKKLFEHVKKNNSVLHVMGLLGKGGVHSHSDHLYAFLMLAKMEGIKDVAVHVFTDGRDSAPNEAVNDLVVLEELLFELGIGQIASVSGRFFSMDRDSNWDRLQKFEDILFECKGNLCQLSPSEELERQYKEGKSDEHISPFILKEIPLQENDGVFVFNFRADRARMITSKLIDKREELNLHVLTLASYGDDYKTNVAFPPRTIETTIAKEVAGANLTQVHIAETEKFPHATYFLNGGIEKPYEGEEHVMLDSRKDVDTHDKAPEMRAEAIADEAIKRIKAGVNFTFINFANPDMVGHTANREAIIVALETVDRELKRVLDALHEKGGVAFVTADHGNAEVNIEKSTGEKHTAHTLNPVPAIVTNSSFTKLSDGSLADIAPTILKLLGIEKPEAMTGKNLVSSE